MWRQKAGVGQGRSSCLHAGVAEKLRQSTGVCPTVAASGLILLCVLGLAGPTSANAASCENERFRTGPSASLPDCRAYELVTPADKGRTQDLTFSNGGEYAVVAAGGGQIALDVKVPVGPNPTLAGARAVFSRNPEKGWEMTSAALPGAEEDALAMRLFSPDLSQLAFESETGLNFEELSLNIAYEVGPVGGPYAKIANIPREDVVGNQTELEGASGDFSDVLIGSVDHSLPLSAAEEAAAKETVAKAKDLYDWSGGRLRLVNFRSEGSLVSLCGAELGSGAAAETSNTVHAVSEDGSKIFFTSPQISRALPSEPSCKEPTQLYMRSGENEPVEISAPEVELEPSKIEPVRYNYATPDGSKVFFNTETPLTGETPEEEAKGLQNKLFEYETEAPEGKRLKLVASGVPSLPGYGSKAYIFSEDGSTVYIFGGPTFDRYETSTGDLTVLPSALSSTSANEPAFTTPNGEFLLFASRGVTNEPRGTGHNELYRYDHATESVMCVTCAAGVAPKEGEVVRPATVLPGDDAPALGQLSDNGQQVFFQTTAHLVPQDENSTETISSILDGHPGLDVYEWEAEGSGGCELPQGCTHMLSSGEPSGPSSFLGASADGSNVFFSTPAQLVQQDTDEFDDIYDARVEGGFAPPPEPIACLSCQGVGSPPPLFDVPASGSFVGAGNPESASGPTRAQQLAKVLKVCRKERPRRRRTTCEGRARKRYRLTRSEAKRSTAHTTKGRR
jgi:hypothetical protein